MKTYGMTWEEALEIAPELSQFLHAEISAKTFSKIIDCLNNALIYQYFYLDTNHVVSNITIIPEGTDSASGFPYFIILES